MHRITFVTFASVTSYKYNKITHLTSFKRRHFISSVGAVCIKEFSIKRGGGDVRKSLKTEMIAGTNGIFPAWLLSEHDNSFSRTPSLGSSIVILEEIFV
jgi:hypothetical protein